MTTDLRRTAATVASPLYLPDGALHGVPNGAPHGASGGAGNGAVHGAADGARRGASPGGSRAALPAPCSPGSAREHGAGARLRSAKPGIARPADGAGHGAFGGTRHGASPGQQHGAAIGDPVDAQLVIYRMEEAGRTLLSLPPSGYTTRLRTSSIDILRSALDEEYGVRGDQASGRNDAALRPAVPSASRITRMDEAFGWVVLIPRERYVIRRIVGCRALVSPITERHLFTWRRIGTLLGADHKAIQRWHAQGIDMIVAAVNAMR